QKISGRIFIVPKEEKDFIHIPKMVEMLTKCLGVISISPAVKVETDYDTIVDKVLEMAKKELEKREGIIKFKVDTHRREKNCFEKNSQEFNIILGAKIRSLDKRFVVDLHKYELEIGVDIRGKQGTFIFTEVIPGQGGLPSGSAGRCLSLLSGGFDFTVASYLMMKRGCTVYYIAFWSYPYIGEKLVDKIKQIVKRLTVYQPSVSSKLFLVPFADVQTAIRDKC